MNHGIMNQENEAIWDRASISCIHERSIQPLVDKHFTEILNFRKLVKLWSNPKTHQQQLENFLRTGDTLLDVAKWKCKDFSQCKCDEESKVSEEKRAFLTYQRRDS